MDMGDSRGPPSDALAECCVLSRMLHCPRLLDSVDLDGLLVFPEHRWIWAALVAARTQSRGESWAHFYLAWINELEARHPGRGWRLHDLLFTADAESERAWTEYERDRDRYPDQLVVRSDYSHRFGYWLKRLRRVAESRMLIASAQLMAELAYKEDVEGARRVMAAMPSKVIRVDI